MFYNIHFQVLQEIGFGLTREVVGSVIMEYLALAKRQHPFKGQPGKAWWRGFMCRWPLLSERKAQHLSKKRAQGANEETIKPFFDRVETLLREAGLLYIDGLDERLWNCDETALCNAVTSGKVLAQKGSRWVHDTAGGSGRSYTQQYMGVAQHQVCDYHPLLFTRENTYMPPGQGGPAGAIYSVSESGWMEKENYESWITKLFLPATSHLRESAPVVLFFDGHHSHISVSTVKHCKENNVHLMLLPSNTTHVLQPLDVGVYGPLKQAWKKILAEYKLETRAGSIGKEEFPQLLHKLWERSFKPQHLQGGFRETGLFPLSYSAIPTWKLAPALPFQGMTMTYVNVTETPIRKEIRKCFIDAIKPEKEKVPQKRQRVKLIHNGEALTSDEVLERLEEEKRQKATKKGQSRTSSRGRKKILENENHCQLCGKEFEDGEEELCLGCDGCWRWVHCTCAGFTTPPDTEEEWLCHVCT